MLLSNSRITIKVFWPISSELGHIMISMMLTIKKKTREQISSSCFTRRVKKYGSYCMTSSVHLTLNLNPVDVRFSARTFSSLTSQIKVASTTSSFFVASFTFVAISIVERGQLDSQQRRNTRESQTFTQCRCCLLRSSLFRV